MTCYKCDGTGLLILLNKTTKNLDAFRCNNCFHEHPRGKFSEDIPKWNDQNKELYETNFSYSRPKRTDEMTEEERLKFLEEMGIKQISQPELEKNDEDLIF